MPSCEAFTSPMELKDGLWVERDVFGSINSPSYYYIIKVLFVNQPFVCVGRYKSIASVRLNRQTIRRVVVALSSITIYFFDSDSLLNSQHRLVLWHCSRRTNCGVYYVINVVETFWVTVNRRKNAFLTWFEFIKRQFMATISLFNCHQCWFCVKCLKLA